MSNWQSFCGNVDTNIFTLNALYFQILDKARINRVSYEGMLVSHTSGGGEDIYQSW